ncbi:unnamed protein product [Linum tenue]|uniref:Uncharacterized protein n=1 Tax=Linum tenue TaxID=586396 RepID=A0AAV0KJI0_9ROSI|nr:unnamed protein product [Linum tenue]
MKKIHAAADAILEALINDHVAKRSSTKHDEEDVLDVLLNLKDNKDLGFPFGNAEIKVVILDNRDLGFPFGNTEIKAVILDIFLAGIETWTVTAGWVISELMKNPEIMAKAQEEVRRVFDGKGKAEVDEAGIHELQYLELVLKETLRLHAPDPLIVPRECQETVVINEYRIEAKTRAICRDPDNWVDPDTSKT